MFDTVLIANRGAIATRIIRTLKKLGVKSVALYHQQDADSLHVQHADQAICLGEGSAAETYLNIDKVIDAAKRSGAQAIHPGYGFLSENTGFVEACQKSGIVFIGPTAEQIELFGLKHLARDAAAKAGVPLVPGSPLLTELADAVRWANDVGYPIMLKSTAGGGGIGMQICSDVAELEQAWHSVKRLSANYFSNDGVFLEKYIANARHIEVQIFGNGQGQAIALGERDCSAQRRNQKVVEETPAPNLPDDLRKQLCNTAQALMASVSYQNAGTVEFIFDTDAQAFYFLEVNTRLQVEHGVTEEVWQVDLVEWMLRQAAGEDLQLSAKQQTLSPKGHAMQVRVYAEDAQKDFRPSAGLLSHASFANNKNLRVDTWIESGVEVPALFDPMIAKVIATGQTREKCLKLLSESLEQTALYGIETNITYLNHIVNSKECQEGRLLTRSLASLPYSSASIAVLSPGTMTTIQDYPARTGLWHVGVPPSGPMDNLSFRLANALLGNDDNCAALELTLNGPTLVFNCTAAIAIAGADMNACLNDRAVENYSLIAVNKGDTLSFGKVSDHGARAYLAVAGGFDCPNYLGSRSTFTLGQFGGHNGRALRTGDVLHLTNKASAEQSKASSKKSLESNTIALNSRPVIEETWQIRVMYGPQGAPDFLTADDIDTFFQHTWEVHYNSSRTGVRLIGPKPKWARDTGGEAGLHPSNLHDNAYAFGAIDFTGDMPVILGPDGPSLGGFVCPATVINADLWKLGQLKAGAKIHFVCVTYEQALDIQTQQNIALLKTQAPLEGRCDDNVIKSQTFTHQTPVIAQLEFKSEPLIIRAAGDHFVLIELGPLELDIARRFKIHALMLWLESNKLDGMQELTPGIRSLQIHFDPLILARETLLLHIEQAAATLEKQNSLRVPTRTVYLPLSWNDEACQLAIEKYMQSVRPGAPWCPSNLEFIRRINGLPDVAAVKNIVFDASYLVMGLGDVYLGAPVATPVDPRHRLVTTKYNPARTWTAENSVGIGGAYLCIYGMEGPGGYQFVGRTLQMWNRYRQTEYFDQPWLLRFFDQVRFYEVSHDELVDIRDKFPKGTYPIKIETSEFCLEQYHQFLNDNSDSIEHFQKSRSQAFSEELDRWKKDGQLTFEQEDIDSGTDVEDALPENVTAIESPVSGSIWQLNVQAGDSFVKGDVLAVLESMKMEIDITASFDGMVDKVLKTQGQMIQTGQAVLWAAKGDSE